MSETWVPIQGYEDFYEVSDQGRVRSLDRYNIKYRFGGIDYGKILEKGLDPGGYQWVRFVIDGERTYRRVHRLVALHFIPNPNNLPEVNHKDFDKSNNCAINLEWVTPKENMFHAMVNGRFSARKNPRIARKLTAEDVDAILSLYAEGASGKDLAKWSSISKAMISRIVLGRAWK